MKVEKEMMYEAPVVEIMEVEVEKGFATSGSEAGGVEPPVPGDEW